MGEDTLRQELQGLSASDLERRIDEVVSRRAARACTGRWDNIFGNPNPADEQLLFEVFKEKRRVEKDTAT